MESDHSESDIYFGLGKTNGGQVAGSIIIITGMQFEYMIHSMGKA